YIAGVWTDVLVNIASRLASWSAWLDVTTPEAAMRWRFVCTTLDTGGVAAVCELELDGVKIG
ncbi:unnamed protein product, partial [marine sediment metagenome]